MPETYGVGVMRWNRNWTDEIWMRAGIEESLPEKVDIRVLRWLGHVERMNEGRWPKKVKSATLEGHQGRGRPVLFD